MKRKLVGSYTDRLTMSQTKEDIFHLAIVRTMEKEFDEVTPESVLSMLQIQYYMLCKYAKFQQRDMNKHLTALEFQSSDDKEWFNPTEVKNAILRESEENG